MFKTLTARQCAPCHRDTRRARVDRLRRISRKPRTTQTCVFEILGLRLAIGPRTRRLPRLVGPRQHPATQRLPRRTRSVRIDRELVPGSRDRRSPAVEFVVEFQGVAVSLIQLDLLVRNPMKLLAFVFLQYRVTCLKSVHTVPLNISTSSLEIHRSVRAVRSSGRKVPLLTSLPTSFNEELPSIDTNIEKRSFSSPSNEYVHGGHTFFILQLGSVRPITMLQRWSISYITDRKASYAEVN